MKHRTLLWIGLFLILLACNNKLNSIKCRKVEIVARHAMVYNTSVYGYVGESSCLFNMEEAERGWNIIATDVDGNKHTYLCSESKLEEYLAIISYSIDQSDSSWQIILRKIINYRSKK